MEWEYGEWEYGGISYIECIHVDRGWMKINMERQIYRDRDRQTDRQTNKGTYSPPGTSMVILFPFSGGT